jgi:hypothetical protein
MGKSKTRRSYLSPSSNKIPESFSIDDVAAAQCCNDLLLSSCHPQQGNDCRIDAAHSLTQTTHENAITKKPPSTPVDGGNYTATLSISSTSSKADTVKRKQKKRKHTRSSTGQTDKNDCTESRVHIDGNRLLKHQGTCVAFVVLVS